MKRFLMILAAMAFTGCGFDYTPPNKASDTAGDMLAEPEMVYEFTKKAFQ